MMNKAALIATTVASTIAVGVVSTQAAQAGTLHQGWNYSIDAIGDGSGGSVYDIKGLAIKETTDDIYVSISANLPLAGVESQYATDHNVGWGDLFFDFSGGTFNEANANQSLFAVNFATGTDSDASEIGVYSNVSAKSVGKQNRGYDTLKNYYKNWEKPMTMGDLETKDAVYSYYAGNTTGENTLINNVIDEGDRIGDISFVTDQEAAAAGLDFGNFNALGNEQITFKFDRSLLPSASYISHLFAECANDGVALTGDLAKDVPEPSAMLGLAAFGLLAARLRRRNEA
ncbi:MAG: PEP-CTERM sorting domain-containing protein [Cyanobacteria bacterium P01_A01_bin.116]